MNHNLSQVQKNRILAIIAAQFERCLSLRPILAGMRMDEAAFTEGSSTFGTDYYLVKGTAESGEELRAWFERQTYCYLKLWVKAQDGTLSYACLECFKEEKAGEAAISDKISRETFFPRSFVWWLGADAAKYYEQRPNDQTYDFRLTTAYHRWQFARRHPGWKNPFVPDKPEQPKAKREPWSMGDLRAMRGMFRQHPILIAAVVLMIIQAIDIALDIMKMAQ